MKTKLLRVLLPFVIGFILAYVLDPLVGFFQHRLRLRNLVNHLGLDRLRIFVCVRRSRKAGAGRDCSRAAR